MWTFPTFIGLPKSFERNVDFSPGNGSEIGYICLPVENGKYTVFTETQFNVNIITDMMILLTLIVCGYISWSNVRREIRNNRDRLEHNEIMLFQYNIATKGKERSRTITVVIICASYIILRFPLLVFGRTEDIHVSYLGLGICVFLFNMQFCFHFLIYAIVQTNYRNAYFDLLRIIFSCTNRCRRSNNQRSNITAQINISHPFLNQ